MGVVIGAVLNRIESCLINSNAIELRYGDRRIVAVKVDEKFSSLKDLETFHF